MVRIALTGAAGNVGREVIEAFGSDHDVVPFTHSETDGIDSELLDVTEHSEIPDQSVCSIHHGTLNG